MEHFNYQKDGDESWNNVYDVKVTGLYVMFTTVKIIIEGH